MTAQCMYIKIKKIWLWILFIVAVVVIIIHSNNC